MALPGQLNKCLRFNACTPQQHAAVSSLLQGRPPRVLTRAHGNQHPGSADSSVPMPTPHVSDEQLIRELNNAHLWLPDEQQSDEFGLDDVAAHVNTRHQAQVLDFSKSRKGGKKSGRSASSAAATLADVDPESGDLPSWVQELRVQGFDVLGREGELFLQRGAVQQQQQPLPQQQQQQAGDSATKPMPARGASTASIAGSDDQAPSARSPAQKLAQQKLEEAAAALPDSHFAVRQEFTSAVWQRPADPHSPAGAAQSAPGDAWYAGTAAGAVGGMQSSTAGRPSNAQDPSRTKSGRANVEKLLLGFNRPDKLLSYIERRFPSWSSNGCWLLHQTRLGLVAAPTPAEAAVALKGVALAAKRAGYNTVQIQGMARDRRVLGLVECLRLTPPRSPAQQPATVSKRLWSAAKAYWLQAGAAAAAAQQQLLTATRMAAATKADGDVQHTPILNGGSGDAPSLGPLLAQLQHSGLTLNKQQLAAAQALIRSRQQDQLRQAAFVCAMWGMSVIGGPLFFQQEMDALCQVAAVGRWKLGSSDISDVLWALASARHWSRLLPQLDAALVAAGGVASCTAPELVSVLWSYATLSYRPVQLLDQLNRHGWAVKPVTALPAAQRSTKAQPPAASKKKQKQQKHKQQQAEPGQSDGSMCRLDELSNSQLTSLVWSLACLEEVNSGLFTRVWAECCQRGMSLSADVRQMVRLHQAALALRLEGHETTRDICQVPGTSQLLDAAAKTFKAQSGALQSKVHSTYQRSIASILSKQRVMHVLEDNTTGYSVDISIPSLRVAIEADGPSHMSRNTVGKGGRVQLGATAMKRRHLQGLGWAVVNINYDDWDALPSEEQRAAFLKQQIKRARAELAAVVEARKPAT